MELKKFLADYARKVAEWADPTIELHELIPKHFLKGQVEIWMYEPNKERGRGDIPERFVQQHRFIPNSVVDAGEIWIAEFLAGETVAGAALDYTADGLGLGLQYCSIGTTDVSTTAGTYDLQAIGNTAPTVGVVNAIKADPNENELVVTATFTGATEGDLFEAGLFSNSSRPGSKTSTTSRMLNRTTFGQISKTSGFNITFQWTIKIGTIGVL